MSMPRHDIAQLIEYQAWANERIFERLA